MRSASVPALVFTALSALPLFAQQSQPASTQVVVQRDPQAVAALQHAIAAMGGNLPSDSTATGTATITAGGATDQGTIRIRTRGTGQTLEELQTPAGARTNVFSNDEASETFAGTATPFSANRAVTSRSSAFPMPFLAGLLMNPDESLQFVDLGQNGGSSVVHLKATNTYASQPGLRVLSEFTPTDIWLDAQTALPVRIGWVQRDGGGASPRIRRETWFSNYQSFGGVLYPTSIQKFFNGTLWVTVAVQSVSLNTGLTDADFPVTEVQP